MKNDEGRRIGSRMRVIRQARGLTQKQLGELVGLSADRIQQYENGQRKAKKDLLWRIADALNVNVRALQDPISLDAEGVMYALFEMQRLHRLTLKRMNGRAWFSFSDDALNGLVDEWGMKCQKTADRIRAAGSEEEKDRALDDYMFWTWNYSAQKSGRSKADGRDDRFQFWEG